MLLFSKNINIDSIFNDQNFNNTLTNGIVSFEQLGPEQESVGPIFFHPSAKMDIFGNICKTLMTKLEF